MTANLFYVVFFKHTIQFSEKALMMGTILEDVKDQVRERPLWRKSMWSVGVDNNLMAHKQFGNKIVLN